LTTSGPTSAERTAPAGTRLDYGNVLRVGLDIDLGAPVDDGRDDARLVRPPRYYHFLAGLIRSRGFHRIVEIGTYYGGSTLAMSRGIADEDRGTARIVTIDIVNLNEALLRLDPIIRRITGDSLDPRVVDRACAEFDGPIDLLFVDSFHQRRETLQNIAVYANRLHPDVIVLDDIRLNRSMRRLWTELASRRRGAIVDVSELVRRVSAGFGVIECGGAKAADWPEVRGPRLRAWLAWRRTHRLVDHAVPEPVQRVMRPVVMRVANQRPSR
jgi:predicted O-methyltransferase YrrM